MLNAMSQQNKIQGESSGDMSPTKQHGSPVKGVMNALSKPGGHNAPRLSLNKPHAKPEKGPEAPMTIEDVPFRRQDRRVLNSRKKRVIDRHIIKCALTIAIFLLLAGSALVALNIMFKSGKLFLVQFPNSVPFTTLLDRPSKFCYHTSCPP